jgi:hypothetical protein
MFLGETISILDTKARNEEKENFYHGILIGILKNYSGWAVKSDKESGDGFADILIKPKNPDVGIIIELKYASSMSLIRPVKEQWNKSKIADTTQNYVRTDGMIFLRMELHSAKSVVKS